MANDCLVTKLKSVVNNDNLPYFDSIVMICKEISGKDFINTGLTTGVRYSGTVEILSGNGYLSGGGSPRPNYGIKHEYVDAGSVLIIPDTADAEVVIKISPKSSIHIIYGNEGILKLKNVKDLDYCINISNIKVSTSFYTKDLADLHLPSLVGLDGDFIGDINNLAEFNLDFLYLSSTGSLTGDVVPYIEQRRNTTPSGSMNGRLGYKVKFNGTQLPFINTDYIWDATSIIAKPYIGDSTTAWTYGATAEQISALENEGYTVVQVD